VPDVNLKREMPWPMLENWMRDKFPDQTNKRLQLMRVQLDLVRRGFCPYTVDGRQTSRLGEALRAFQRREGLPQVIRT